ncbi:ubiquitin-conjugating enzyme/RWD-like protein [Astrocystis sublimbata]|nr:ubiquitin-conjugating enzyme/RWD-like protein [Astrocystis sublimbata]
MQCASPFALDLHLVHLIDASTKTEMNPQKFSSLPALRRQHLLAEFAGLRQACPDGVYVALTPGDPSLWSGAIFVRDGPYAPAVMRFQISFPDSYPRLPPLVTFSTDMFHPLITPLSVGDNGAVSATDVERLPPGGFSLRHGFPEWYGRRARNSADKKQSEGEQATRKTPHQPPPPTDLGGGTPSSRNSAMSQSPGFFDKQKDEVSIFAVLHYIRSTFDDEDTLDAIPQEAAGNAGAWHAWRTYRVEQGKEFEPATPAEGATPSLTSPTSQGTARRPGEWNWEGVWEERVKKGVAASLSEPVMFGGTGSADDVLRFLNVGDDDLNTIRENLLRTMDTPS